MGRLLWLPTRLSFAIYQGINAAQNVLNVDIGWSDDVSTAVVESRLPRPHRRGGVGRLGSDAMSKAVDPPDDYEAAIVLRPVGGGTPRPGDVVELIYQVDDLHGLPHELEQWDGAKWSTFLYGVASEREEFAVEQGTPWSESPDDLDVVDIGFEGRGGGLFLTLPDDAQGRVVRVCATGTPLCSAPHDFADLRRRQPGAAPRRLGGNPGPGAFGR